MALLDWQTGWQGSLGWKAAFLDRVVNAHHPIIKAAAMRSKSNAIAAITVAYRPHSFLPELHIEFLCAIRSAWRLHL
jgi:hypothetical protein